MILHPALEYLGLMVLFIPLLNVVNVLLSALRYEEWFSLVESIVIFNILLSLFTVLFILFIHDVSYLL